MSIALLAILCIAEAGVIVWLWMRYRESQAALLKEQQASRHLAYLKAKNHAKNLSGDALAKFIDDELMRARADAERMVGERTAGSVLRPSDGASEG